MTKPAEELIAKLEKLGGPDREVDADITIALTGDPRTRPPFPYYTESIDAALTLVPKGWIVEIHRLFDDDGEYWSRVILIDSFSIDRGCEPEDRREVMSYGPGEPPRFIAAAALRARAAVAEGE